MQTYSLYSEGLLSPKKCSYLPISEVEVITHFHRQRPLAAAAEVHDAILAAAMRDIVDCEHSLTRRIPLKKKRHQRNEAYAHHQVQIEAIFKGNLLCSFPAIKKKKKGL